MAEELVLLLENPCRFCAILRMQPPLNGVVGSRLRAIALTPCYHLTCIWPQVRMRASLWAVHPRETSQRSPSIIPQALPPELSGLPGRYELGQRWAAQAWALALWLVWRMGADMRIFSSDWPLPALIYLSEEWITILLNSLRIILIMIFFKFGQGINSDPSPANQPQLLCIPGFPGILLSFPSPGLPPSAQSLRVQRPGLSQCRHQFPSIGFTSICL